MDTPQPSSDPQLMLGPWLVGASLDLFLMGLLVAQFLSYFRSFGVNSDSRFMKGLVWGVLGLNVIKTVQCFVIIYRKLILHFNEFDLAITHEFIDLTEPLTVAVIGFVVHGYFTKRCWLLANRNYYLLAVLCTTMLIALGGALALTIIASMVPYEWTAQTPSYVSAVVTMLSATFVTDVIISGITFFHFWNSRTGGGSPTDTAIERLIIIGWQCAIPPTFCTIFNLAFFVSMAQTNVVFITFNILLAKLYSLAMMHTINSREELRRELYEGSSGADKRASGVIAIGGSLPFAFLSNHSKQSSGGGINNGAFIPRRSLSVHNEKRKSFLSESAFHLPQQPSLSKFQPQDMVQVRHGGAGGGSLPLLTEGKTFGSDFGTLKFGGGNSRPVSVVSGGVVGQRAPSVGSGSNRTSMNTTRSSAYFGTPPPFPPPSQPIPPLPGIGASPAIPEPPKMFRLPIGPAGLPGSVRPARKDQANSPLSISTSLSAHANASANPSRTYTPSPLSISPLGTLPPSGEPASKFAVMIKPSSLFDDSRSVVSSSASSVRTTRSGKSSTSSLDKDLPPLPPPEPLSEAAAVPVPEGELDSEEGGSSEEAMVEVSVKDDSVLLGM